MSWLENLYVLKRKRKHLYSIKSFLKFMYSRKQSKYLYLVTQISHFISSCTYLHLISWIPSKRLLTRFDNELVINLALSIICNMQDIYIYIFFLISSPFLSVLLTSFSIGTVKVILFSVFSPKQVNCFLNSSANSFMIKW